MTAVAWPSRFQPTFRAPNGGARAVADAAVPGVLAVLLWSLWPALALRALPTPPFLLLTVAFGAGFLVFAGRHRLAGGRVADLFGASFGVMAAALLGIVGSSLCYVLALRLSTGIQATGLAQAAPAVIVLAGALFLALCAAIGARLGGGLQDLLGGVCGVAAPLCLILHLGLEPRIALGAGNLLAAAAIGLGPIGLAGTLWGRATGGGDRRSLMGLVAPALAIAPLMVVESPPLGVAALVAGFLVIAGVARRRWPGPAAP